MSGFTENVELGQIGEIKKDSAVVMRVQQENRLVTTGCAGGASRLTTFRRLAVEHLGSRRTKLYTGDAGWIQAGDSPQKNKLHPIQE